MEQSYLSWLAIINLAVCLHPPKFPVETSSQNGWWCQKVGPWGNDPIMRWWIMNWIKAGLVRKPGSFHCVRTQKELYSLWPTGAPLHSQPNQPNQPNPPNQSIQPTQSIHPTNTTHLINPTSQPNQPNQPTQSTQPTHPTHPTNPINPPTQPNPPIQPTHQTTL